MFSENYNSCMFEEICLIDIYGSKNEKRMLELYIKDNSIAIDKIAEIADSLRNKLIGNRSSKVTVS